MPILQSLLAIVHGVLAVGLIGLILLQQGKGADAGASFGSGSSSTVFGSTGSGNFLTRLTSLLAMLFLINCLALAWLGKQQVNRGSILDAAPIEQVIEDNGQDTENAADSDLPIVPGTEQQGATGDDTDSEAGDDAESDIYTPEDSEQVEQMLLEDGTIENTDGEASDSSIPELPETNPN